MRYALAVTRLALSWVFLWSFFDKTLGWNFSTTPEQAWIRGASPTLGYLSNGVQGPLADFYHRIAGLPLVDWLFMIGLLAIGLGLLLGVATRITTAAGVVFMLLMYSSFLPPVHNPVIDEHIIYALLFVVLVLGKADETWGLGRWWKKLSFVKRRQVLR